MLDMEDRIVKLERWQNQHTDPHKADQAIEHYRQEAVAVEKKYATLLKAMKKIVAFDYVAIPQVGIMDKITVNYSQLKRGACSHPQPHLSISNS